MGTPPSKTVRVAIITRSLTTYRLPAYKLLFQRSAIDFQLFYQRFNLPPHILGITEPDTTEGLPVSGFVSPAWTAAFHRLTGLPLPCFRMLGALMRYKPDVVILEGISNAANDLLCAPYLLIKKIPFIWWSIGNIPATRHTLRAKCGVYLQRWFLRHASASLAYSSYAKKVLIQAGAEPDTVHILYNTLDERNLLRTINTSHENASALRKRLGLTEKPVIIFSGTINKGKKLDLLIRAFAIARKAMAPKDPRLIVIGDGPELNNCIKLADKLELSDAVHFAGRQTDMSSAYFLLGNIAVLPGLGGLAINHAFAHKLPVICGRADGCEEDLVFDGDTGIRLHEVNEQTLSNAMCELLSRPLDTKVMGGNAYKLITEKITLENLVSTIEHSVGLSAAQKES